MTTLTSTLDTIDRVLAECDARNLPPLAGTNAAAVLDLAEQVGLQLDDWQRHVVKTVWADPARRGQALTGHARPSLSRLSNTDLAVAAEEPPDAPGPMRGWFARWIRRHR